MIRPQNLLRRHGGVSAQIINRFLRERRTGFEPATLTLGKVFEFVYQGYCRSMTCCFVHGPSIGSV